MKRVILALITLLTVQMANAQILTPVHWSYGAKKINSNEAMVFIKATIDPGWHVYSQFMKDGGPVKTTITFTAAKDIALMGKTQEPKAITEFEKAFNMNVSYFENSVVFQQKVKLPTGSADVKGTIEYMTCNNKQCLPPDDVEFNIPVK